MELLQLELSRPKPPHFPSAGLTSKPPDQTTRSLNSGGDVSGSSQTSTKNFHPSSFSAQTLIDFAVSFHPSTCVFCLPIARSHEYMSFTSLLHRLCSDSHARSCASSTYCCISSWSSRAALSSPVFPELVQSSASVTVITFRVISHTF